MLMSVRRHDIMKLHFLDHPHALYDYLVPREYQPLLEKGAIAWCLAPRLQAKKS